MSEVGVEIVKTEETKESGIKYLNINVSNNEVERNPDIVRLCADAGILEYVKPKTGQLTNSEWIDFLSERFDISRTTAKDMLNAMMRVKARDNFRKQFSGGK